MKNCILIAALLISPLSFAKELTHRLGVGFRNTTTMDIPSVAAFYYPSPDLGVIGQLGLDTKDQASKFHFGVELRRIVFKEENMNFFMAGDLGLVSQEQSGSTDSGFELGASVGAEFFLHGLDNLGFNFQTGVGVTNVRKVRFNTTAWDLFKAGIVFYF
jgi:hypothetical protein